MLLFLLFYFLTYGLIHFYIYRQYRILLKDFPKPLYRWFCWGIHWLAILSPFIFKVIQENELWPLAQLWGGGQYWIMVCSFLFFCVHFSLRFFLSVAFLKIHKKILFLVSLFLVSSICIVGRREAENIYLNRVLLEPSALSIGQSTKILLMSDLHLGNGFSKRKFEKIQHFINEEDPEYILSTGDFVDERLAPAGEAILHWFREENKGRKMFAVLGNHEAYIGEHLAKIYHRMAGFQLLDGELWKGDKLLIAGVSDSAFQQSKFHRLKEKLKKFGNKELYSIFMYHRPSVFPELQPFVDLQLSGHTHGGQVFPFHFLVRWIHPYKECVLHSLQGMHLYVSRGCGTWGPSIRFLAPPEITILEL